MAKILVIDDDPQIRTLLTRVFTSSGHDVRAAENGAVGVKMLGEEHADLMVTDLLMPEKEGLETIMEVKRDFPDMKIVAISGGDRDGCDFLPMTKPLGADHSLRKPFSISEISQIVEDLLT